MTRKSNKTYVKRGPNSLQELKQQTSAQDVSSIWNDLTQLQIQCQQVNQSPGQVISLLRNQELVDRIANKSELNQLASTLNKDVQHYGNALSNINQRAEQHRGAEINANTLHILMDIASEYDEWITSYQLVVVPTAIQITELFNNDSPTQQV